MTQNLSIDSKITYNEAVEYLVSKLSSEAELHEKGAYEELGQGYDDFDFKMPRDNKKLMIALVFWDAWIDERNHNFQGFYNGISVDSWPELAKEISDALKKGSNIENPLILQHFDLKPKKSIISRIFGVFKGK